MIALIIDGTVYGLQLSLLAAGLTLIFGLGGVLTLAHGQFAVITGVVTWLLLAKGMGPVPAAVLGVIAAGLFGLVIDRTLMVPAYRLKGEPRLLVGLLLTLGLAFIVEGYLNYAYPQVELSLALRVPSITIFGLLLRTASVLSAAMAVIILAGLLVFLRKSRIGKAIRSIIQNEVGAELCGINPSLLRMLIFVMGGAIAGLVGITQALNGSIVPSAGFELTIFALIVTTVGGVRSIQGTLAAGILLGIVHAFSSYYVGAYLTFIVFLATAMITLLVKPSGLWGHWT